MRTSGQYAIALFAVPGVAVAHGGISAIGALLPFFIALWVLGAALSVWLIYSIMVAALAPESLTHRKQRIYRRVSFTIVWMLVIVGLLVGLFAPELTVIVLVIAGIVGGITKWILNRNADRFPDAEAH